MPEDITPRPPFVVHKDNGRLLLSYDAALGGKGEQTVLGGLKTKAVDVVVSKQGIGPCVALSVKGTIKSFRNLTNRLEEAAGDCTNLHMVYPALVYGFWSLLRCNRPGSIPRDFAHIFKPDPKSKEPSNEIQIQDLAVRADGRVANSIIQYGQALEGLTGRNGVRDDVSKYEAVAITLVDSDGERIGQLVDSYPATTSPLRIDTFFRTIYREYDLRFVYQAPALARITRRRLWDPASPVFADSRIGPEVQPRIGDDDSAESMMEDDAEADESAME